MAALPRRAGPAEYQAKLYGVPFCVGFVATLARAVVLGGSWLGGLFYGCLIGLALVMVFAVVAGLWEGLTNRRGDLIGWLITLPALTVYYALRVEPAWLAGLVLSAGVLGLLPEQFAVRRAWRRSRAEVGLREATIAAFAKLPLELPEAVVAPLDSALAAFEQLRAFSSATPPGGGWDQAELLADAEATLVALAQRAPGLAGLLRLAAADANRAAPLGAAVASYQALADTLVEACAAVVEFQAGGAADSQARLQAQVIRLRELAESRDELEEALRAGG